MLLLGGCAGGPAQDLGGRTHVVIGHGAEGERTLALQPVSGARLSSPFGVRRDPFTGQERGHRGLDFAAAAGTAVHAAGDGVVVVVGPRGSYGNYVRIRHDDRFETAYAHLDRYAESLAGGRRVRQGEVIGYVGSSGRSTGPHLHYEILVDGSQADPLAVGPSPGILQAARSGIGTVASALSEAGSDLLGLIGPPLASIGGAD
jgi:murein DD-endopeptidase MepM/ murein hydrolase activator NlpD